MDGTDLTAPPEAQATAPPATRPSARDASHALVRGDLAAAGRVKRYACWPTLTDQPVGLHCWHVWRVWRGIWGEPDGRVCSYIMLHDAEELITGDPPFPTKRDNPDLKAAHDRVGADAREFLGVRLPELTADERRQFKIAELIEMMEHGMHEVQLGNALAAPIVQATQKNARELNSGQWPEVDAYLAAAWEKHLAVLNNLHRLTKLGQ